MPRAFTYLGRLKYPTGHQAQRRRKDTSAAISADHRYTPVFAGASANTSADTSANTSANTSADTSAAISAVDGAPTLTAQWQLVADIPMMTLRDYH